ncbi:hypothetical protein [uncultured Phenylobacterium sp.]|uniref:hypothetical protein n=1 Tax=uncultured Phenylobacterium sp. TaxID=349273 RepID=UPI0025D67C2D|nr:hypothetical protein [uncultured Phenylobacterium sp.]
MHRRLLLTVAILTALPGMALDSGGGEKKKSGGGTYLPMNTLLGTMIRASGKRGVLSVDCGLDVPDPTLHKLADQSLPRLRAAYVQTVQGYAAGLPQGALPNADYLGLTLQRQTDTILGRPGAKVLLGAIIAN